MGVCLIDSTRRMNRITTVSPTDHVNLEAVRTIVNAIQGNADTYTTTDRRVFGCEHTGEEGSAAAQETVCTYVASCRKLDDYRKGESCLLAVSEPKPSLGR